MFLLPCLKPFVLLNYSQTCLEKTHTHFQKYFWHVLFLHNVKEYFLIVFVMNLDKNCKFVVILIEQSEEGIISETPQERLFFLN